MLIRIFIATSRHAMMNSTYSAGNECAAQKGISNMDRALKEQYVQVLFRFRKSGLDFPKLSGINMSELVVMAGLSDDSSCPDKCTDLADIQKNIHITKAAISQMFTSLENRGYVVRETDKTNRRKITVVLTDEGKKVLKETKEQVDLMLEKTLSRFGEDNTQQLISLLNRLSDISDEIKNETNPKIS